jgi:hypothetical protein
MQLNFVQPGFSSRGTNGRSPPAARVVKVPPHPSVVKLVADHVGNHQHDAEREHDQNPAADDGPYEFPSLLRLRGRLNQVSAPSF